MKCSQFYFLFKLYSGFCSDKMSKNLKFGSEQKKSKPWALCWMNISKNLPAAIMTWVFPSSVSPAEFLFTEPLTCYMLDGILILYCLIATVLYFREKVRCSKRQEELVNIIDS